MNTAAPSRRSIETAGLVWILLLLVSVGGCSSVEADDPRLEQSRALVASFGMRLKSELSNGLQAGGPVQAIGVCKDVAPQIASELSRQSGAKVARTSLRYRNPANAPEPWQAAVLRDFEARADDGSPLEYFAREADGTARYMSVIRTDGVCLACHGVSIPPEISESIATGYPHDRAVGYALGDVRGAFSITWPPP